MKYTWILDAGHGGMINGKYVTAPDKMYEHSPSEIFYEGVFNRQIKDSLMYELRRNHITAIDIVSTSLDVPLDARVGIANIYHRKYSNCVGISLHSNAGKGSGFEVHTSMRETRSDKFAAVWGEVITRRFPHIKFRKGDQPGEWDKDSAFYILQRTTCPWILPECLFFDQYNDYLLLEDADFRIKYVKALVGFIMKAESMNI